MFKRLTISDCTFILAVAVTTLACFEVIPWWTVLVEGALLFLTDVLHTAAETAAAQEEDPMRDIYEIYWNAASHEDQVRFLKRLTESIGPDRQERRC